MAQLARFSPAAVVQRITRGGDALGEPARTIDEIVDEATKHRPNLNAQLVRRAYETAVVAHEGQLRSSGEPYVTHPVAVTYYLATLQMDDETLAAALLHDVPEDTDFTIADIEKAFGREVARLVDGVTKLSKFGSARTMEEQQAENIRKMFLAMAEDVRVVIIKLADRLHNMRTLDALPAEKQQRIARQTMEIYAPLAHRLGMWQIKWELEDLAFKYTEPEKYRQLVEILADQRRAREGFVNKSIGILRKELEKVEIKAEISGRPKHLYSISKKMERKGAEFTEIYDLNAIRVLVDDVKDCYAALGIVHSLWRPVPGQFDDYIAMPKANMYQSLHTAVIGPEAKPLEVQIRTYRMHEVAEAGIAAHWRYKEGSRSDRKYDEKLAWVRNLMDWQREVTDPQEFVEGLKLDVFQDQVFVFTPKGDVKDLPRDATPLDFAYRIHTDVGHRTIGAKVNNRLVPLDYRLRNGDIVEIVTTKAAHGPSRDWLNIVRTSHAREKIRAWFKRQQRDENIAQGKDLLDRELRRLAHETLAGIDAAKLTEIASQYKLREMDDFYAAIGYGAISSALRRQQARDPRRRGHHPARDGAAGGAVHDRGQGQGRRRPAGALREVLLTDPRRRHRRLRHAWQGRDGAPRVVPIGAVGAGHRAADRRGVGAGRTADLSDHRADLGAGSAGAAERGHQRRGRVQGQHRGRLGCDASRWDRRHHRDLQGHLAPAARQGAAARSSGCATSPRSPARRGKSLLALESVGRYAGGRAAMRCVRWDRLVAGIHQHGNARLVRERDDKVDTPVTVEVRGRDAGGAVSRREPAARVDSPPVPAISEHDVDRVQHVERDRQVAVGVAVEIDDGDGPRTAPGRRPQHARRRDRPIAAAHVHRDLHLVRDWPRGDLPSRPGSGHRSPPTRPVSP